MENFEVRNNEQSNRFEADINGKVALISYREEASGALNLHHTEVPPEFEGKGVGSRLVKQTLEQIKRANGKIVPSCPFVAAYIERHPEYESLIEKSE